MLIGYARVSTDDQDPALQIKALEDAGCEQVFVDHKSGKNLQRPEWKRCKRYLQEGDTLMVWKLDRLARSVLDLCNISQDFDAKGIQLVVLTQQIDTRTPAGRMLFTVLGAIAEFERELIAERTREGIKQRKAAGMLMGRVPVLDPQAWQIAIDFIKECEKPPSHQSVADHIFMTHRTAKGKLSEKRVSYNTISKYREKLDAAKPYPKEWQDRRDQESQLRKIRKRQDK